eukprot:GGOE01061836.1.p1 GENE.GGOE01061836.1~~GGOE01061836.1.p1  ORF type:complete len:463 (+),score=104.14 GGOE01061836.1:44-1390(+)
MPESSAGLRGDVELPENGPASALERPKKRRKVRRPKSAAADAGSQGAVPRSPGRCSEHPDGFTFFRSIGSPKFCVAPMVNQSELAFRMLCRRHGATLAYTPMILAQRCASEPRYREMVFQTCPEDRPLIVQFAGHDAASLVQAALQVQDACDAVDLNLGCPQDIAFQGRYGAALMDSWEELHALVRALASSLRVPVCCKIRVYTDAERTVAYARMLRSAGCSLLGVHGRTVDQKGSGVASWETIRRVVEAVDIPVLANGNIRHWADVGDCLRVTGAAGVMSAEALLTNPALFTPAAAPTTQGARMPGLSPPGGLEETKYLETQDLPALGGSSSTEPFRWAEEYLTWAARHPPCSNRIIRRHLFHFLTSYLHRNTDLYDVLYGSEDLAEMTRVVRDLQRRAVEGVEVLRPRANGRPRRCTSDGRLCPPPIGGVGGEDDAEGGKRKRKRR